MSFLEKVNEAKEQGKKPSVSIPDGSIVKAILTEIDYTKEGKAQGSIIGGIGVKFAFLGYYKKDKDGKDVYVETIDYSDLSEITFPIDQKFEDGTWGRPGLMSKPVYLSKTILRNKDYIVPNNTQAVALLYASQLGLQLGVNMQEPFIHCLNSSGLCGQEPLNALEMGLEKGFNEKFPIVHLYRNTSWKFTKSNYENNKLKPGSKESFHEHLTANKKNADGTWDETVKSLPVELVDAKVAIAIYDALQKRNELKKAEAAATKPTTSQTSSGYTEDVPF